MGKVLANQQSHIPTSAFSRVGSHLQILASIVSIFFLMYAIAWFVIMIGKNLDIL